MRKILITALLLVTCAVSAQETGFTSAEQSAKEDLEYLKAHEFAIIKRIRASLKESRESHDRMLDAYADCLTKAADQSELKKCKF